MTEIFINTRLNCEFLDITAKIQHALDKAGAQEGICLIFCPHTTAGLLINEHADPAVAHDILSFLEELVPRNRAWSHAEGNAPAHIKATLVGNSLQVAFAQGRLLLGTWQGIFFCEFDGPRQRKIWVRLLT